MDKGSEKQTEQNAKSYHMAKLKETQPRDSLWFHCKKSDYFSGVTVKPEY